VPIDKERFVTVRAEDYRTLREIFERSEVDIDADDDLLAAQLGSIKWTLDSRMDQDQVEGRPAHAWAAVAGSGRHSCPVGAVKDQLGGVGVSSLAASAVRISAAVANRVAAGVG
jgi:hypothetical protein